MSGSLNKVQIIGKLGRDPESRSFANGGKVVNIRVATSETWKDKNSGERKEKTEWHAVTIWNEGTGNFVQQYLRKGSMVYIEGALETRKWQDSTGADRYSTEITVRPYAGEVIALDKPKGNGQGDRDDPANGGGFTGGNKPSAGFDADLDDDVPF